MDDNNPPGTFLLPPELPPVPPSGWSAWGPPPRRTDTLWQRLPEQTKLIVRSVGIGLAVAALGVSVQAIFHKSTTTNSTTDTVTNAVNPDAALRQACVVSWNGFDHPQGKSSAGSFVANGQTTADAYGYATVAFSSAFPDRCMMTIGNPGKMYAEQFVQDASSGWPDMPVWNGPVSSLDPSSLQWNARIAADGTITLGGTP